MGRTRKASKITDQRDDLKAHKDVLYSVGLTTEDKSVAEIVVLDLTPLPVIVKEEEFTPLRG